MASQCPRNDRRGVEMLSPALATHCMPGTATWPQPAARLGPYFSCAVTLSSCNAPQGDLAHIKSCATVREVRCNPPRIIFAEKIRDRHLRRSRDLIYPSSGL